MAGEGEALAAAADGEGIVEAAGDAAGEAPGLAAGLAAVDGEATTAGETAAGADVGFAEAGGLVGAEGAAELHAATISAAAVTRIVVGGTVQPPRGRHPISQLCTAPFYVSVGEPLGMVGESEAAEACTLLSLVRLIAPSGSSVGRC